jgi:DNA-binding Xre family transcriptional regulator
MDLTFSEQLEIILKRKKLTKTELAKMIGTTPQNLYNQMERNNFKENDMKKICEALKLKYVLFIEDTENNL